MRCVELSALELEFTDARIALTKARLGNPDADLKSIAHRVNESQAAVVKHMRTCLKCRKAPGQSR
jgi:hypothetical protein